MKSVVGCVTLVVGLLAGSTARAQVITDSIVEQKLRLAVGASPNTPLSLTRDSAPGMFPGAVFVRTTWDNHGAKTSPQSASVVIANDRLHVVTEPEDMAGLSCLGAPFDERSRFAQVAAWHRLLQLTGVIGAEERVVSSAGEIREDDRGRLTPSSGLNEVKRPSVKIGRRETTVHFTTFGKGQLVGFRAVYSDPHSLRVEAEPLARFILTGH
jgi:hypothetical protein